MKIIKLNAIGSTNSFLKDLAKETDLENLTTVVTKTQTKGRGQRGSNWHSKDGKNLLFSTIIYHKNLLTNYQTCLNFAVSLAIFDALKELKIPKISIKWPNDIMAENKKVCGILIENVIQNNKIQSSLVGIGLNVNQQTFPDDLPNASSIINFTNKKVDLDFLLDLVLSKLSSYFSLLNQQNYSLLKEKYIAVLYKKNIPTAFKDNQNIYFMGLIKGVSSEGKLQIQLEDDSIKEFDIKEVSIA